MFSLRKLKRKERSPRLYSCPSPSFTQQPPTLSLAQFPFDGGTAHISLSTVKPNPRGRPASATAFFSPAFSSTNCATLPRSATEARRRCTHDERTPGLCAFRLRWREHLLVAVHKPAFPVFQQRQPSQTDLNHFGFVTHATFNLRSEHPRSGDFRFAIWYTFKHQPARIRALLIRFSRFGSVLECSNKV